ncbi:MAG: molybdopterin-dependent oxidoreductase, partial [Anaerolineales bacterium]|nr:molybdopterin-dependent oxidoreductase [Anaerolineales bacterium]
NETGRMADVILPGISFAEKSGTFTNTERRVQLIRPALEAPGSARQDWCIVADLANRLGAGWQYDSAVEIFTELAKVTPQYAGMSHRRLEREGGLQWPCPTPDHPGTPYLHKGKFTRGLGMFSPVPFVEAAELPDDEFPFFLSTGRVLFHWHGGTMSRRSPGLESLAPEAEVEIHPQDGEHLGVKDGQLVQVASRRGQITARANLTRRSPPGTVFMTFHYAEAAANILTPTNVDPVAKIPEYKVSAVKIEPLGQHRPAWQHS